MKTETQIMDRIKESVEKDMLGFTADALAQFCPEALEKPENARVPTKENVLGQIREYLEFAFEKALDHRGISANRSVAKLTAWIWLLEETDQEFLDFIANEESYKNYGMPILKSIARRYGFPMPDAARDWVDGQPCKPYCSEGCGR